jgi:Post-segregation antitoxin CcdA
MEVMATRDDVTVRIDTELRAKARELEINMSRLFEDALAAEIDRRETLAETLSQGIEVHEVELEDKDGVGYIGRITGKHIAEDVYLTDDERVIVYRPDHLDYYVVNDPKEELNGLPREEYNAAMAALGLDPIPEVIDL